MAALAPRQPWRVLRSGLIALIDSTGKTQGIRLRIRPPSRADSSTRARFSGAAAVAEAAPAFSPVPTGTGCTAPGWAWISQALTVSPVMHHQHAVDLGPAP